MGARPSSTSVISSPDLSRLPSVAANTDVETFFAYRTLPNGDCDAETQLLVQYCRQGWDEEVGKQLHAYSVVDKNDRDYGLVREMMAKFSASASALSKTHGVVTDTFPLTSNDASSSNQTEKKLEENENEMLNRAFGCFLGLVVGDAIGAPLEFHALRYNTVTVTSMGVKGVRQGKFKLLPGQWTDDSSMALCLADSFLKRGKHDELDSMLRYLAWWQFGYNNSCVYDKKGDLWQHSVGLGSNISDAMHAFKYTRASRFTQAGDKNTSGIGSIMRLAPLCIFYRDAEIEKAMEEARNSSLVTHQGEEGAECCRLLAFCCITAMNQQVEGDSVDLIRKKKRFLGELIERGFTSSVPSVMYLAASRAEPLSGKLIDSSSVLASSIVSSTKEDEKRAEGRDESERINPDRDWNWKQTDYRYSTTRAALQGGSYTGAYAMDAMAMALHCVWHTNSFEEAMIKAINLCGDADSLGAVVGQLAGALYGMSAIPAEWVAAVQQWDEGGLIALRAYKLFHKQAIR